MDNRSVSVPSISERERLTIYDMVTDEASLPGYFLNGGDHFDDIPHGR